MRTDTAITLINNLVFLPGWTIWAEDYTHRFEESVCLHIHVATVNTNREEADDYESGDHIEARAAFVLTVADIDDVVSLYRAVLDTIVTRVFPHEAREAFRDGTTHWAPFHPHKVDGMKRWGDMHSDLTYGLV